MSYVLITGASSGIGKSIAYTFAAKGHDLIIVARRSNLLEEMKTEIESKHGVKVVVITSDLSEEANAHALYEQVKGYELKALINNAGFGNFNNVWEADIPHMMKMIDLNIKSLTVLSILFSRDYKDKEAQLINVASVVGYATLPASATYSATKFYVSAFTESLAIELKMAGATMKAKILAPGPVETEFFDAAHVTAKNEFDKSGFTFHSSDEMAGFTYDLYESDGVLGIVNLEDMSFNISSVSHPSLVPVPE